MIWLRTIILFLAQVVNLPTVVETMRHVVPIGGDYEILDHFPEIRERGPARESCSISWPWSMLCGDPWHIDSLAELGMSHIEIPATPERIWQNIRAGPRGRYKPQLSLPFAKLAYGSGKECFRRKS